MKVLVVDDDPNSRLILDAAVRRLGHDCRTAFDGTEAWEMIRSHRPDVVISDWIMPGLSGVDLCRRIRSDEQAAYTYIIMVTSNGGPEAIFDGMGAGADDYLVKPVDLGGLQARLIAAARVTALHRGLSEQRAELNERNGELTNLARLDPLTGLGNRRALEEDLELLEARVRRYAHRYCVALADIDHFKSYNDTYGHPAGDLAIQDVASQLRLQARAGDSLYRYGGEEFLCIFPEQSLATGSFAVERMRVGVERLAIPHTGSAAGVLTISAGLAVLDPGLISSAKDVVKQADDALYRAKVRGRNRVEQPQPARHAS